MDRLLGAVDRGGWSDWLFRTFFARTVDRFVDRMTPIRLPRTSRNLLDLYYLRVRELPEFPYTPVDTLLTSRPNPVGPVS
jgi:hypothetical protein